MPAKSRLNTLTTQHNTQNAKLERMKQEIAKNRKYKMIIDNYISLKFMGPGPSDEIHLRANRTTKMWKMKECISQRIGISLLKISFIFDGRKILDEDTAEVLDMDTGDVVEIYYEQERTPHYLSTIGIQSTETLQVKVVPQNNGQHMFFNLKLTTKMLKLKKSYSQKTTAPLVDLHFTYKSRLISDEDTPEDLNMMPGDIIEVINEKIDKNKNDIKCKRVNLNTRIMQLKSCFQSAVDNLLPKGWKVIEARQGKTSVEPVPLFLSPEGKRFFSVIEAHNHLDSLEKLRKRKHLRRGAEDDIRKLFVVQSDSLALNEAAKFKRKQHTMRNPLSNLRKATLEKNHAKTTVKNKTSLEYQKHLIKKKREFKKLCLETERLKRDISISMKNLSQGA